MSVEGLAENSSNAEYSSNAAQERLDQGSKKAKGNFHQAQADYYAEKARNDNSIIDKASDIMNQGVEKVKATYYNATASGEANADAYKEQARIHAEVLKEKASETIQGVKNTMQGVKNTIRGKL